MAGVNVPVILPGEDEAKEQPEVAGFARGLAGQIEEQFPGHSVRLTGIIMINQALDEAVAKDASSLVPLMFGLIIVALCILLRSIPSALAALAVIACA